MTADERYADLLERAEQSVAYWSAQPVAEFIDSVCRLMKRRKMKRKDLADKLGTSRAYVTKLLGGNANLSIATMVKVAMAMGGAVHTHVADKEAIVHWIENYPGDRPKLVRFDFESVTGEGVETYVRERDSADAIAQVAF